MLPCDGTLNAHEAYMACTVDFMGCDGNHIVKQNNIIGGLNDANLG